VERPVEPSVAQPEPAAFSLVYYDHIFGSGRGPAFWELVGALADELDEYALAVEAAALGAVDAAALAALRHAHQPLVQNLGLGDLAAVEQRLKAEVEATASHTATPTAAVVVAAGELARIASRTARLLRNQASGAISVT